MNILIIPSWYPDVKHPLDGIFIKEQTEALAGHYPQHNFAVSHCANYYLSLSSPGKAINTLNLFLKSRSEEIRIKKNLIEFNRPVLTWTDKIHGEANRITDGHENNLLRAQSVFGKIDLIHAHVSYPAGYSAMNLKNKYKIPFILTEHMGPFPFERFVENGKISAKISRPLMNADILTAPSSFQSEIIFNSGFKKPVVIPNMVNEKIFYPGKETTKTGKVKFFTLSSFIPQKGIYELTEGIKIASEISSDFEFTIAGSGELESYIKNFILQKNLSDRIKLIVNPERAEAISLFGKNDVFILASRLESFGIVYVEALASGIPVIATDCGGPSDFVNKDTGLLIEKENQEKIAEAIVYMTKNIFTYDKKRIRNFFLLNFSDMVISEKIISIYEGLLNNH